MTHRVATYASEIPATAAKARKAISELKRGVEDVGSVLPGN